MSSQTGSTTQSSPQIVQSHMSFVLPPRSSDPTLADSALPKDQRAHKTSLRIAWRTLLQHRFVLAGVVVILVAAAVLGYNLYGRATGNFHTSTATAYQIEIKSLNQTMNAVAGSTVSLLFNVTSPKTGALYFYASAIPKPGLPWEMSLQNVTTDNIVLPAGVSVSYPTGQAVFGTNHTTLTLKVAFAPAVNGTVGLVVGAFQQVNQDQVVGTGNGVYITVQKP